MSQALAIIPARYASTRFPGKLLANLGGVPVLKRTLERASLSKLTEKVIIATDDERIFRAVESWGGVAIMTSSSCRNGTERVYEALRLLSSGARKSGMSRPLQSYDVNCVDVIVNVQGDEPLVNPNHIDLLISRLRIERNVVLARGRSEIATACAPLTNEQEIHNPNVVKVVLDIFGRALYFSRAAIPGCKKEYSQMQSLPYNRHIGLYAFRRTVLESLQRLDPTPLEQLEELEQLRWLENGFQIAVERVETSEGGVDTPEQLAAMEEVLKQSQS